MSISKLSPRYASYVVGEHTYWVTTIHWVNELTGRDWNEAGFRDLERAEHFVLVQHGIRPLEAGHREMVRLLKQGMTPEEIRAREPWIIRGVLRA